MALRAKMSNLLGQHARLVPWATIAVVALMLVITLFASVYPLYQYAIRRETSQVEAASKGFTNFLSGLLDRSAIQAYSASQDASLQAMTREALQGDNLRGLRRKLLDLSAFTKTDIVLIARTDGRVLASYPEADDQRRSREGKRLAHWPMLTQAKRPESHVTSVTSLEGRLYAASAIPIFQNGKRLGTLVLGFELGEKLIKDLAMNLTAELMLAGPEKKNLVSTLRDSAGAFVFFDAAQARGGRLEKDGHSYAVKLLPLKTNTGKRVATLLVAKSLDSFLRELAQVLRSALLLVGPLFLLSIAAIFFSSNSLKVLTLSLQKTSTELAQTVKDLRRSQSSLKRRIRDSNAVLHMANLFIRVESPERLAAVMEEQTQQLLGSLKLEAHISLESEAAPSDAALAEPTSSETGVRWRKQFITDIDHSRSYGELRLIGDRPISDREKLLMETLFATAKLSIDNLVFLRQLVEKSQTEAEVRLAQDVQAAIMPQVFPSGPGFAVAGFFSPATILGGDWQGCFYDEATGKLRSYIGDVTGHGVPSALIAAAIMSYVQSLESRERLTRAADPHGSMDLLTAIRELDEIVRKVGKGTYLMSFLMVELDVRTGEGRYIKAAHPSPLIVTGAGDAPRKPRQLLGSGDFLGLVHTHADAPEASFALCSFQLGPSEALILYTDGCIEATNASGQHFGLKRFKKVFTGGAGLPVEELLGSYRETVRTFVGQQAFADDLTMMIVKTDESFAGPGHLQIATYADRAAQSSAAKSSSN